MVRGLVQPEMQFRDEFYIQIFAEATPDVAFGAVQAFDGVLSLLCAPQNTDMHFGILEVVAQLDPGDGREPDARVLQPVLNELRDFLEEQFLDSL